MTGYYERKRKICIHEIVKCAICRGTHLTNLNRYTKKHKAKVDTQKLRHLVEKNQK